MDKFKLPKRFHQIELNQKFDPVDLDIDDSLLNLTFDYSEINPPPYLKQTLSNISLSSNPLLHQYSRDFGNPRLVNAISKLYSKYLQRTIDPNDEIIVTVGAYQALHIGILGHVDKGDEVIIIEPYYPCYVPLVRMAGGIPKILSLKPDIKDDTNFSNWKLDPDKLASMFNEKTKAIIINTPHYPTGKMFTEAELLLIADLCKHWNVLCIMDEVFENAVYKIKHIRMASLDMWDRTLTIGSAGKTFCATGWKIGWVYGPSRLLENLRMIQQNCVCSGCTPIQESLAFAFETEIERLERNDSFFKTFSNEMKIKRDYLIKVLLNIGMKPIVPDGGPFIVADYSPMDKEIQLSIKNGSFTEWMKQHFNVLCTPLANFCNTENMNKMQRYICFCFFKKTKTLEKVAANWLKLRKI